MARDAVVFAWREAMANSRRIRADSRRTRSWSAQLRGDAQQLMRPNDGPPHAAFAARRPRERTT
jgi:hypothetical protein